MPHPLAPRRPRALVRLLPLIALLGLAPPVNVPATDGDGDGLLDTWERQGYDATGDGVIDIDFPAMGADPRRKDLFIEVDWMVQDFNGDGDGLDAGEHTHKPRAAAVQAMVTAFANSPVRNPDGSRGITVHVDTGQLGGGNSVTHFHELDFSGTTDGDRRRPSIAANANGALVVWEDDRDKNGVAEIWAQRVTTAGVLQGEEFLVNPVSTGQQRNPAVAMNTMGAAVIVWEDDQNENGYYEIHASAYPPGSNTAAFTLGDDNPVNSVSSGQQLAPVVAIDAAGNFVVTWADDQDGNGYYEIHARGFDNTGAQRFNLGNGNPVNSVSAGQQLTPAIAMNAAGNFVVTWMDDQDGNGYYQILARGFAPAGTQRFAREDGNPVNTAAAGQQRYPAVAIDDAGNFVVVWEDDGDGNGYYQIHGRGFDPNGAPRFSRESASPINSQSSGQQLNPTVAMDAAGGAFTVAWDDDQDDNGYYQLMARGFTAAGTQRFADLTVNGVSTGQQRHASVTILGAGGNTVIAWDDDRFSSGHNEVFVRGLTNTGAQAFAEARAHGRGTNATYATVKGNNFSSTRSGLFHYALWVHRRVNTGSSGIAHFLDDDLIVSLGGFTNQVGSVLQQQGTFMHELGHNLNLRHGGNENRNRKPNYNSVMNYKFQMPGIDTSCDAQGDGVLDYSIGVRTRLDEDDLDEPSGVCDGTIVVNSESGGQQLYPRVGMSDAGNFVVTWQDDVDGNGYYQVLARGFTVNGAPRFSFEEPSAVNRVGDGQQTRPAIAMAPQGQFAIAWEDDQDENGYYEILARVFDNNGNQRFAREQPNGVNSVSSGQQQRPAVAMDGTARPVFVWQDDQDGNGYWQIHARAFSATGAARFRLEEPTVVNSVSTGQQVSPAVAMNAAGAFVVTWMDDQDKNGYWEIHARGFNANGTQRFSIQEPTAVNTASSGQQINPVVAIDGFGNIVVVWQDDQDKNGYWEILARGFTAAGVARFSLEAASPLNRISAGQQLYPSVACANDGRFVVAWQDDQDDNGYYEILARVLGANGAPLNAVAIDWNGNGAFTTGVAFDINNDEDRTNLSDYDDWEHIRLDF